MSTLTSEANTLRDPVGAWTKQKLVYMEALGKGSYTTKQGWIRYYPLTTAWDVYTFASKFHDWTGRSEDGYIEQALQSLSQAFGAPDLVGAFKRAEDLWKASWPSAWDLIGSGRDKIFWNNANFWEYGGEFAIERSVIGAVPSQWSLLKEAVSETVAERIDDLFSIIDWKKWALYGIIGFVGYKAIVK